MADIDLDAALNRARGAAKQGRETTREVPAYAQDVNRFVIAERERKIAQAAERPLSPLDYAYNLLAPLGAGADPRTRAAIGEAASMGVPTVGTAAIDTLTGFLTGGGPGFGENLKARQDEARLRKAYAPYAATATEIGVAAPIGGTMARGAQAALGTVLPRFAASPAGSAVAQGAAGAAEGAGYSAATGEGDPMTAALIGGGVGGALGAALPLTGQAAIDAAKREASERMFGPLNVVTGRGAERPIDVIDVLARRRELGPQATIMDLDPAFRGAALGATNPRTIESAGPLFTAAGIRQRPVDDILMDDLDAAIGPSYGKVARQEDREAIFQGANQQYNDALAEMRQQNFTVDAQALRADIESAFEKPGVNAPTSEYAAARDRMLAELDLQTGYRPPRYNKKGELTDPGDPGEPTINADTALQVKKSFDAMVTTADPAKSIDRQARAIAIDVKNALNDQLKANPKFAAAAKVYADEFDIQNAEKFAGEVFKGNYSADDFAKMYAKMSDMEKQAVARAARDEIQVRFIEKPGGGERFSRRVGPTQDAAFTQKLDTVFGQGAVDKLYEAAMRARAFGGTAKTLEDIGGTAMLKTAEGVGGGRQLGNIADIVTVAQQLAQGRGTSGATAGAVRRLFLEGKRASNEQVQQQMLGYLGKQGPAADESLMEIMSYLYGTAPPRMATGTGAAVGAGAATGFGAVEGPQRR